MKSPTGSFQFLDGGTLDLGLVRDSTLNAATTFRCSTRPLRTRLPRWRGIAHQPGRHPEWHRAGGRGGGVVAGTDRLRPCGVKTRLGKPCRGVAIRGSSRCWMHGGSAPQVRRKAAQNVVEATAVERARRYGTPRKTTAPTRFRRNWSGHRGASMGWASRSRRNPTTPACCPSGQSEKARLARLSVRSSAVDRTSAGRCSPSGPSTLWR